MLCSLLKISNAIMRRFFFPLKIWKATYQAISMITNEEEKEISKEHIIKRANLLNIFTLQHKLISILMLYSFNSSYYHVCILSMINKNQD